MTSVSRTAQFTKLYKVLKKYYRPAPSNAGRTVMEHLLFACCLEDAHHDAAEEAFAAMVHTFFDWNEVRVTSISELSEVMACLPDPRAAANRIKRVLHAVFEATFTFDLEDQRKKNLGPTVAGWRSSTARPGSPWPTWSRPPWADTPSLSTPARWLCLHVLDLVTDKDVAAGVVPGLERAIPKSKGMEFGSLLHELGADFSANPYSSPPRDSPSNRPRRGRPAAETSYGTACGAKVVRRCAPAAARKTGQAFRRKGIPPAEPPTKAEQEKTAGKKKSPPGGAPPSRRSID